jgi:methionyl-tRNA formyltransferase
LNEVELLINAGVSELFGSSILDVRGCTVINAHIGDLPRYRNRNAVWWSLYNGDPLVSTVHIVTRGVDTGPILWKETVPATEDIGLDDIWNYAHDHAACVLGKVARDYLEGSISPVPQETSEGFSCYVMHPTIFQFLENRFCGRS